MEAAAFFREICYPFLKRKEVDAGSPSGGKLHGFRGNAPSPATDFALLWAD